MKFQSYPELEAHWNYIDAIANDNGATSSKMQHQMIRSGNPRLAAISAWRELMPHFSDDVETSRRVFQALFDNNNPYPTTKRDIEFNRTNKLNHLYENGFASQYEDKDARNSFGHLIDILESSEAFRHQGFEEIADKIKAKL